jgi:hypothetical protein
MKLDPGSTQERPSVAKTATPAIIWVVAEVTLFTALLGLGMHALAGLEVDRGQVNAPGHRGIRDQMLRRSFAIGRLTLTKPSGLSMAQKT